MKNPVDFYSVEMQEKIDFAGHIYFLLRIVNSFPTDNHIQKRNMFFEKRIIPNYEIDNNILI